MFYIVADSWDKAKFAAELMGWEINDPCKSCVNGDGVITVYRASDDVIRGIIHGSTVYLVPGAEDTMSRRGHKQWLRDSSKVGRFTLIELQHNKI